MDENASTSKRKINVGILLGISAVFLSASALIVSIIQTNIFKEQQYASVWPYLQPINMINSEFYDYGIENKGIGPAIIKDFVYTYKESSYESTRELFFAIFGENTRGVGFTTYKDYVFKSGEALSLLSINLPDSLRRSMIDRWEIESANLKIIYSDIYGNCWKLDRGVTTRLSSCPD